MLFGMMITIYNGLICVPFKKSCHIMKWYHHSSFAWAQQDLLKCLIHILDGKVLGRMLNIVFILVTNIKDEKSWKKETTSLKSALQHETVLQQSHFEICNYWVV